MSDPRNKHAKDWIVDIKLDGKGTTTWEDDFVDSLETQTQAGRELSEKQLDILERIYTEKT